MNWLWRLIVPDFTLANLTIPALCRCKYVANDFRITWPVTCPEHGYENRKRRERGW